MRRALDAIELDYRSSASAEALFDGGAPNPTARAALLPDLERVLRAEGVTAPFTFECRGWVCRLLVLQPAGAPVAWRDALQRRDLAWRERVRGGKTSGRTTQDPLSGARLDEVMVMSKLAHPDGVRVPFTSPLSAPVDVRPVPESPLACQRALDADEQRLGERRQVIAAQLPPDARFSRGTHNAALTKRVQALVTRALAGLAPAPVLDIECRGEVCRIAEAVPSGTSDVSAYMAQRRPWWKPLTTDPALAHLLRLKRAPHSIGVGQVYFPLAAP